MSVKSDVRVCSERAWVAVSTVFGLSPLYQEHPKQRKNLLLWDSAKTLLCQLLATTVYVTLKLTNCCYRAITQHFCYILLQVSLLGDFLCLFCFFFSPVKTPACDKTSYEETCWNTASSLLMGSQFALHVLPPPRPGNSVSTKGQFSSLSDSPPKTVHKIIILQV